MAMVNGPRPNNQGGDDDKDISFVQAGQIPDTDSVVVPTEVSNRELRFCLLQVRCKTQDHGDLDGVDSCESQMCI